MDENNMDFASVLEAINQIGIPEESLPVIKEGNDIPDIDINDISKIKAFGNFLDETGKSLAEIHHQLNVHAKQVCEGWGDDKNRRLLMNKLEQSQDKIDELVKEMQGYSSYINQLCKTLDIWKENINNY